MPVQTLKRRQKPPVLRFSNGFRHSLRKTHVWRKKITGSWGTREVYLGFWFFWKNKVFFWNFLKFLSFCEFFSLWLGSFCYMGVLIGGESNGDNNFLGYPPRYLGIFEIFWNFLKARCLFALFALIFCTRGFWLARNLMAAKSDAESQRQRRWESASSKKFYSVVRDFRQLSNLVSSASGRQKSAS